MKFGCSKVGLAFVVVRSMQQNMRALVKDSKSLSVRTLPEPKLTSDDQVIVQVMLAGLCRTDIFAAEGKIQIPDPLILGHEFSGVVTKRGAGVSSLKEGQRVAVNPVLSCGVCAYCLTGDNMSCPDSKLLGIDCHGCFAGYVAVPVSSAHLLPDELSFLTAAYVEPVAASLSALKTGIRPQEKGLIYGNNRFAQLMLKVLKAYGFNNVDLFDHRQKNERPQSHYYDFVIETMVTTQTLIAMVEAIRPGGKVILKSRKYDPITFSLANFLKKEPIMQIVNYGKYEESLRLLSSGQVQIDDLVDGIYKLENFSRLLSTASEDESLKPFFSLWDN